MGRNASDLAGQRFGSLVAEYRAGHDTAGYAMWVCTCDCGGMHHVRSGNLKSWAVTRCKRCSALNVLPAPEGGPRVTVVAWVWAIGEEGGFAVAKDSAGHVIALTPWSKKRQKMHLRPESLELVQRVLTRLVQEGVIAPPSPKEGSVRWCQRVGVGVMTPRRFTPWPQMLEEWVAAGGSREDAHPKALPPTPPRVVPVLLDGTSTP